MIACGRVWIHAALLTAALYACTLWGTYVYDDVAILTADPRIETPGRWHEFWTEPYNTSNQNLYRPITSMTYAVQWWLHGHRPWAFHAVNVVLASVVSAMVALLGGRLAGPRVGLIAGLVFAVHPAHVEAVANIVGRAELLCAIGLIGGLLAAWERPLTGRKVVAILGCYLLSLLGKEPGLLFPLVLAALLLARRWIDRAAPPVAPALMSSTDALPIDYAHDAETLRSRDPEREAAKWLVLGLCVILSSYIVLREQALGLKFWWDRGWLDWAVNPLKLLDTGDRWLMVFTIFGHYVSLLIAPMNQSPDYSTGAIGLRPDLRDPYFWIGVAGAMGWIVATVVALVHRHALAMFCLLGFAITYGVISNALSLIGTIFGERLIYVPSVFAALLAAALLARLPRRPATVGVTLLLLVFSFQTARYAWEWNDAARVFERSIARQSKAVRLYVVLADIYTKRSEYDRARELNLTAQAMQPDYVGVWIQSALTAMESGRFEEAAGYLDRASAIDHVLTIDARRRFDELRAATQSSTENND